MPKCNYDSRKELSEQLAQSYLVNFKQFTNERDIICQFKQTMIGIL